VRRSFCHADPAQLPVEVTAWMAILIPMWPGQLAALRAWRGTAHLDGGAPRFWRRSWWRFQAAARCPFSVASAYLRLYNSLPWPGFISACARL
jgi:hypothetical protein